ncbi:tRNA dihydrouridine synthase [Deinococcus maricopensis]|uniref:tRNA-dihydrouridine synthase n=1 Tax=Deinococcus maricopensis (strain DSM 21211 / LMG 22137 / NRRL B-23946 / LB-34) TaxID=709986 RepID=E8U5P4_DEIML|nr:tRNA-dihydrouridine synthase family protein [Deinococcus maricopensis]ADV66383.1 dihydrouridine synthase DuS [Deinococcus maricopensis DSM 21211]
MNPGFYTQQLQRPGAVLAPMAGYSDAPMRALCSEQGALWTVSEMLSARGLLEGDLAVDLGQPYPGEQGRVLQLFGADPDILAAGAQEAVRLFQPAALDLNMGCPVPKIKGKGGACLLQTPDVAYTLVKAMRDAVNIDVSAKIRLGWDTNRSVEIAQGLEAAGAALITVHGRTSAQRYTGYADWDAIAHVAASVRAPVIGSGDVTSAEQAHARRAHSGVAAVMIGRGAVGNPWVFRQTAGTGGAPTPDDRLCTALRHAELNVHWYGERRGMLQLRKVLHRYFPDQPERRDALVQVSTLQELHDVLSRAPQAAD